MAKSFAFSNETVNTNAQCKVVVYPWVTDPATASTSDQDLSKSTRLDISSQVQSVTYTKNIGEPAGTFSILLTNSPGIGTNDWKDILRRGFWLVIYMSQDGDLNLSKTVGQPINNQSEASKIRGICYIERAGVKSMVDDSGSIDIGFEITGKDFGIIYEETTIWQNMFRFDKIMLDSIASSGLNIIGNVRVDQALNLIHDLFYFPANIPGAVPNSQGSLLEIGLQWLLPKEMLLDVGFNLNGLTKGTYWGALPGIKNFQHTAAGLSINSPTDFLSGNAWDQLKKLSIPQLHEMFCETTIKGIPQLTFRPIPWAINKASYPTIGQYISQYTDLSTTTVQSKNLFNYDLAEDDHARYNSFLVTISTGFINVEDNISLLDGSIFPYHEKSSIKRHGFRPMHITIDTLVQNGLLANGVANRDVLIEYNYLNLDYWNQAVFAETGTVAKVGSNDIKVGTALEFSNDNPYLYNKRYYIEGYTDTFTIGENGQAMWEQQVMVTRGFDKDALKSKTNFSNRPEVFEKPGEFTPSGGL